MGGGGEHFRATIIFIHREHTQSKGLAVITSAPPLARAVGSGVVALMVVEPVKFWAGT